MPTAAIPPSPAAQGNPRSHESGPPHSRRSARHWPLERILFLMAGTMTALSAVLSAVVSPWFLLLTGFVALNQLAFVTLGNCPSSWAMRRYLGVKSACEQ
ncbi:MAG: DUF2892 domain-containing protein [Solirubrobacterales bacterium]